MYFTKDKKVIHFLRCIHSFAFCLKESDLTFTDSLFTSLYQPELGQARRGSHPRPPCGEHYTIRLMLLHMSFLFALGYSYWLSHCPFHFRKKSRNVLLVLNCLFIFGGRLFCFACRLHEASSVPHGDCYFLKEIVEKEWIEMHTQILTVMIRTSLMPEAIWNETLVLSWPQYIWKANYFMSIKRI